MDETGRASRSLAAKLGLPLATFVACTAVCAFVARPAYAEPVPAARTAPAHATLSAAGPAPLRAVPVPPAPTTTTPVGPLANKILAEEATVEALGQQLQAAQQAVDAQAATTDAAYQSWQIANAVALRAQQDAASAAARAYEENAQLGPLMPYKDDLQQLELTIPGSVNAPTNAEPSAVDAADAALAARAAYNVYTAALSLQESLQAQAGTLQQQFSSESTSLDLVKQQNAEALALAAAQRDALNQEITNQLPVSSNINGETPGPQALAAVAFAMDQLGKPYVFGAEGPNSYDCSGLTWASYQAAGVTIPRIARFQQHALTPVSIDQLLPGDLLFFSPLSQTDWTKVSHVAMYIGNGKMIEAPTSGENVKIAPIWWAAYFSAARVVPAVPGPTTTPTPTPTTPTPTPSPTPSPTPKPKPSPSPSPSPTPTTPSPTPTPTGTPTSPSGSPPPPSDSPTPTPTDTPTPPPPTDSPTPTPTDTPTPTPTPSDPPTPSDSPSPADTPGASSPAAQPSSGSPTP